MEMLSTILDLRSVGNSHRPASPRPTTLEEDQELFVDFSSILCLWFAIQAMRTYNFFDWVSNTGPSWEETTMWLVDSPHKGPVPRKCFHGLNHINNSWDVLHNLCMEILLIGPGKFEWKFRYVIFKQILVIGDRGISCEIALIWMSLGLHWSSVNIGSGNGLVPSGNKPLPEPMLTHIFVAIWRH